MTSNRRFAQKGHADLTLLPTLVAGLLAVAGGSFIAAGVVLLRWAGKVMGWL